MSLGEVVESQLAYLAASANNQDNQHTGIYRSPPKDQKNYPGIYGVPTEQKSHAGIYCAPAGRQQRFCVAQNPDADAEEPKHEVCSRTSNHVIQTMNEIDVSTDAEIASLLSPVHVRLAPKPSESLHAYSVVHSMQDYALNWAGLSVAGNACAASPEAAKHQDMKFLEIGSTDSCSTSAGSEAADVESQSAGSECPSELHSARSDCSNSEHMPLWSARIECSKLQIPEKSQLPLISEHQQAQQSHESPQPPSFGSHTGRAGLQMQFPEDLNALEGEMAELTRELMALKARVRTCQTA